MLSRIFYLSYELLNRFAIRARRFDFPLIAARWNQFDRNVTIIR